MTTHFGFQKVTPAEKTQKVLKVFTSVASKYDLMNDFMSFGLHRLWKDSFIRDLSPYPGMRLLDMAGGTGDITLRFLKKTEKMNPRPTVLLCDMNKDMLEAGCAKIIDQGIVDRVTYECCDAASVPFQDATVDAYTIAFGLRNVTKVEQALQEAYRVLKPGGRFLCLEFSKVGIPFLNKIYKRYSFNVIPKLGKWIARDEAAYQYLVESIERFPDQETLKKLLEDAGFHYVKYRNLSQGIVAIHSAVKG